MEDISQTDLFRRITTADEDESLRDRLLFMEKLFKDAGVPSTLADRDTDSPGLYVKLKSAAPTVRSILLFGSIGSRVGDGLGAAVFALTLLSIRKQRVRLPFDLILLITCDNGGGSGFQSVFERFPKLFDGVQYAIGDLGGRPFIIRGKKLYPITVAEKQTANIRITVKGPAGLSSAFNKKDFLKTTAAARIARAGWRLRKPMAVRCAATVKIMADAVGKTLGEIDEIAMRFLLRPRFSNLTRKLLRSVGVLFVPLLRNHVNLTSMYTDECETGAIPQTAYILAELRLLPGLPVSEGVADVRDLIGPGYEIEILECDGKAGTVDMTLFESLTAPIVEKIPDAKPIPFVSTDATDARFLTKLGIQVFGYTPMYPPDIHAGKRSGDKAQTEAAALSIDALSRFLLRHGR